MQEIEFSNPKELIDELMKLKDVEIVVMNDDEYGDHLNQLFDKVKEGKISESEPQKIVARNTDDIGKILVPTFCLSSLINK